MNYMTDYAKAEDYLGKIVKIKIDRPLGSKHPSSGFIYQVNYGFVPETKAPDGEELDAYLLGVNYPVKEYEGRCIAYVKRLDDHDDKLIIVPRTESLSKDAIKDMVYFQEQFFDYRVITKKDLG